MPGLTLADPARRDSGDGSGRRADCDPTEAPSRVRPRLPRTKLASAGVGAEVGFGEDADFDRDVEAETSGAA